jgi:hypothetical protein
MDESSKTWSCSDAAPAESTTSYCPAPTPQKPYDYGPSPWVRDGTTTEAGLVPRIATTLTFSDRLGAVRVRFGVRRMDYRVAPGLYALGRPIEDSPVLVTANYKLTFDVVRSAAAGLDAWLLVLDTRGINVWCAAGKGTFSTEELAGRVAATGLERVVKHRTLVVPQLGATGVAKHRVREACGFNVVFGPVRITDLPAFLAAGMKATPEMRAVQFPLRDRAVLVPVEASLAWDWRLIGSVIVVAFLAGFAGSHLLSPAEYARRLWILYLLALAPIVSGAVLVPLALPVIPGRAFSTKGAITGAVLAAVAVFLLHGLLGVLAIVGVFLSVTAVSSSLAMFFTGSTPFTSPSGVEKEMRRALPLQVGAGGAAVLLFIAQLVVNLVG